MMSEVVFRPSWFDICGYGGRGRGGRDSDSDQGDVYQESYKYTRLDAG